MAAGKDDADHGLPVGGAGDLDGEKLQDFDQAVA
jgi:hypothetical protein